MDLEIRFWSKADTHGWDTKMCWAWTGYTDKNGYGRFKLNGNSKLAHQIAYELLVGKIPDGLEIDHLCRNTSCVNPNHLEAVTHLENLARGNHNNQNTAKDCCPQGHPYDRIDTRGKRCCSICRYEAVIRWRKKNALST